MTTPAPRLSALLETAYLEPGEFELYWATIWSDDLNTDDLPDLFRRLQDCQPPHPRHVRTESNTIGEMDSFVLLQHRHMKITLFAAVMLAAWLFRDQPNHK